MSTYDDPPTGPAPGDPAPMTRARAEAALSSLLDRAALTHAQVGGRFPLFAEPGTDRWTTSRRGSWTGGFWAGLLWLRARVTGDAADREAATRCTGRLAAMVDADTVTRGLIFWYGTALADDPAAKALRDRAAHAVLASYEPELGLVPWGSAFGGERLLARVDGVPGIVPLLSTVSPEVAAAHLRRHLQLCLAEQPFTWCLRYDTDAGWTPRDEPPRGWARGPAWLLLAVADAVQHHLTGPDDDWSGPYEPADLLGVLAPTTLRVPPADATYPDGPRDTSAAALTAFALLKFGRREQATVLLTQLVRDHLTEDGRLLDGCYDLGSGTAVRHELVWGSFFLACALAVLTGVIDAGEV
ncbi:sugar ABC transporter permease [Streptomyces sp. NPDC005865]|uniref:sugar ABC transporter permease n=1 Tax=Streptomyces sp. NPDC005865 TaxID=3155453 RepID=UPI0033D4FD41